LYQANKVDACHRLVGGAFPLANHTAGVGFSIQYFRPGDLVGKDEFDVSTGDIGGSFGSYAASFGMRLTDTWSFGVTGKWIQAKIDDVSATTYAADAGTLLKLHDTLTFGAAVTNLGKKLTFIREGDSLPTAYRVGATWRPFKNYQFSLDGIHRLSGLNSVHTGVELFAGDLFSARFGYSTERTRQLSAMAGFSAGMGLHIWGQQFDYAFVPVSELGQTHYFSAIFKWGVPQKTIEEEKESSLLEPGHSTDESMDPLLKQGGRGENHSASDLMKENNDIRQELIEGSDASTSSTNELIDKNETLKREMIDDHE
jgi:hypothetical protein